MKLKQKKIEEFVKIQIGRWKSGTTGFIKPTKTISVEDTNVDEVHDKIEEMIKNEK